MSSKLKMMQNKILYAIFRFGFCATLLFFGLNQFFHFLPEHIYPKDAQELITAFSNAGYIFSAVGALQLFLGVTLLFDKYIPLGLLLFAPILTNVILFHLVLDFSGIVKVVPTLLLYSYFLFYYKSYFINLVKASSK